MYIILPKLTKYELTLLFYFICQNVKCICICMSKCKLHSKCKIQPKQTMI